jgi:Ras-related protein Rab-8A
LAPYFALFAQTKKIGFQKPKMRWWTLYSRLLSNLPPNLQTLQKEYDNLYKILIIGDAGVGKSSLLLKFCDGTFPDKFITSIGGDYRDKVITVDGSKAKLQLWDTAGQERFRTITGSYYRGAHGVALCFDVGSKESYTHLEKWVEQLDQYAKKALPKIVVGMKTDLATREISTEEGQSLAKKLGFQYIECSAKGDDNVDAVFTTLTKVIKVQGPAGDSDDDD